MKIKEITNRNRRDFHAIYECEFCGYTCESSGYDDSYFHQQVIPQKVCDKCGKSSVENTPAEKEPPKPMTPRYDDNSVV